MPPFSKIIEFFCFSLAWISLSPSLFLLSLYSDLLKSVALSPPIQNFKSLIFIINATATRAVSTIIATSEGVDLDQKQQISQAQLSQAVSDMAALA